MRRRKHPRLWPVRILTVCVLSLMLAGIARSPAVAQESPTFVAEPVPGSQLAPSGGYFLLEATPGQEIRQSIGLRNDGAEPLELRLNAVDAVTGQLGGASYGLAQEEPTRTGAWITLERSTVALAAGESAVVSFRVTVPSDARSGEHLAGLSIAAPPREGGAADPGEGQAGVSVDVETRRVIAVQVKLPGPDEPELVINGVAPAARPDGLYLEIAIENRGRGLTKAQGVLTVGDGFEREFEVDTFVPETAIAYPVKWRAEAPDGEQEASVELRYGDEIARWDGTVTVGEKVRDELADRQVAPPEQDRNPGVPVAVIVGSATAGAALIVGGAYAAAQLRRPRGEHAISRREARRSR